MITLSSIRALCYGNYQNNSVEMVGLTLSPVAILVHQELCVGFEMFAVNLKQSEKNILKYVSKCLA